MFVVFDEVMVFVFKMIINYFILIYYMIRCLKFLYGNNVGRLNVVFEFGDLFLEIIKRDFFVFDDKVDLEFFDIEVDGDEFGSILDEVVFFDGMDIFFEGNYVGFIICGEVVLVGMLEKVNY